MTPDLSLIRPFDPDLLADYEQPFLAHFFNDEQHLLYVAARHMQGPDNETFRTVRCAFEFKPRFIIIEGVPTAEGVSPPWHADYVRNAASDNFAHVAEPAYTAYLALQNGIPYIGGEPTYETVYTGMLAAEHLDGTKKYSNTEVQAFFLLYYTVLQSDDQLIDESTSRQWIENKINTSKTLAHIPADNRITADEFLEWYNTHKPDDTPFWQLKNQDRAPIDSPTSNDFQKMSCTLTLIRDRHLATLIGEKLEEHGHVLVVYGSGHLAQTWPVWRALFENVDQIKLGNPETLEPRRARARTRRKPKTLG